MGEQTLPGTFPSCSSGALKQLVLKAKGCVQRWAGNTSGQRHCPKFRVEMGFIM